VPKECEKRPLSVQTHIEVPVLQTRSVARPFRQLPDGLGDYSHLARLETEADPFIRARSNWKEGDPHPLDLGLVMKESFTFTDRVLTRLRGAC
jgi:hypothetical protein